MPIQYTTQLLGYPKEKLIRLEKTHALGQRLKPEVLSNDTILFVQLFTYRHTICENSPTAPEPMQSAIGPPITEERAGNGKARMSPRQKAFPLQQPTACTRR
jgi:hypothetical protein